LSQALIGSPAVLVLDEPTIGLDPTQIIEIRKLIQDLSEEHTILLSSHILPEVAQICRRVLIINKGQIVATDAPASLTDQMRKSIEIIVEVRSGASEFIQVLERMEGVESVALQADSLNRFVVKTDRSRDLRPEIARTAIQRDLDLLEMRLVDVSLEDIFVQLVTEEQVQPANESMEERAGEGIAR
jgi:ABC-2 type transport system ATP-binding protein